MVHQGNKPAVNDDMANKDVTYISDLATLKTLNEPEILDMIARRYEIDNIYTYIGDILLAVNPFKPLNIYSFEISYQYANSKSRNELPPHIFAVASKAYGAMQRFGKRQSCVISGESGAGKTETSKYLIGHIISHCSSSKPNLQEKILQVNPLLEAFGNACTVMNDNSSRFGKYLELQFRHDGTVVGARIDTYLLEKSRLVTQEKGERNFHIFYFLFAGQTEQQLENVCLVPPESYRILNSGGQGVYLSESHFQYCQVMFDELQDIMELVGFTQEQILMIFKVLSAILQITQVKFDQDQEMGGAYIEDEYVIKVAASLLELDAENLIKALITNTVEARGEKILILRTVAQADEARDALAKSLYSRMFKWIVDSINKLIAPDSQNIGDEGYEIGILDIYGFENFQVNSFEQLCINLTNEQLQFYFNQRIFKWELEEYSKEGIKKNSITFQDNMPVLDLLLGRPMGVFSLLDEESRFPKASDVTFVNKLSQSHHKNKNFIRDKRANSTVFGIKHYAGIVSYDSTGFLAKNRDTFSKSLMDCMLHSSNGLIRFFFSQDNSDLQKLSMIQKEILQCKPPPKILHDGSKSISRAQGKKLQKQMKNSFKKNKELQRKQSFSSVGSKFKISLTNLMEKLLTSEPQFIRCLKPNLASQPNYFDFNLILRQLRYNGVLETIRIRREGYPVRLAFDDFLKRYKMLVHLMTTETKVNDKACKKILKTLNMVEQCEIGKTKVFLKYWHAEKLDSMVDERLARIIKCQKVIRGHLTRKRFYLMWQRYQTEKLMIEKYLSPMSIACLTLHEVLSKLRNEDLTKYKDNQKEALIMDLRLATRARQPINNIDDDSLNTYNYQPATAPTPATHYEKKKPPPTRPRYGSRDANMATGTVALSQIQTADSPIEEEILDNTIKQLQRLNDEAWVKLFFMEKNVRLSEFVIKSDSVIVDGHQFQYPGRLGFGSLKNPLRDDQTDKIRQYIGRGVQIEIDNEGNVWATRLSRNKVIVKGCFEPDKHCISREVIEEMGNLENNTPRKIFDFREFKVQIAKEHSRGEDNIDHHRLAKLSIVSISFVKDTIQDVNTPCWISMVILPALRLDNFSTDDREDVERLLMAFQSASHKGNNKMGRSTSRRWARSNQRNTNVDAEGKTDGRAMRIQQQETAQQLGMDMRYSWQTDADNISVDSNNIAKEDDATKKGRSLRSLSRRNIETYKLRNFSPEDLDEALSQADQEVQEKKKKLWAKPQNQKGGVRTIFGD